MRHTPHSKSVANRSTHSACGLTLIELLVVLTIIGLITALATVRLTGLTSRARSQQAIEQLTFIDAGLRSQSARFARPSQLQLEMNSSRLQRKSQNQMEQPDVVLAGDVRVTRFLSPTRDVSAGPVTLVYSDRGTSDTFAIELSAPGKTSQWLLFAGWSGQSTLLEEERDVQEILRAFQPSRLDAG